MSGSNNTIAYANPRRMIEFQATFPLKVIAMRRTEDNPVVLPGKQTIENETYPVIFPLFSTRTANQSVSHCWISSHFVRKQARTAEPSGRETGHEHVLQY